jgi:predicted GH43/DUF377 family glycosyl hydrolase
LRLIRSPSRRAFLETVAGACAALPAGASGAIDIRQGAHEGTALDPAKSAIVLSGSRSGTYTSTVVPAPSSSVAIDWQERWTGPLRWEKHAENPLITPAEQDGGMLSTPCILKDRGAVTLFYGSRPYIRVATGSMSDMRRWKRRPNPVFSAGPTGEFDAAGVNGPEVVRVSEKHWRMYYVGYHPTASQGGMPVHQLGVAESENGGLSWRRVIHKPAIAHGPEGSYDAFSASACSVARVGSEWWLWYGGIAQVPYLASICLATSRDGISWKKFDGNPVLRFNPYVPSDAFVVARPQVLVDGGIFRMWYSAKGLTVDGKAGDYRVCYAESHDGIHWERFPGNPVLRPSESGWDQKMVEYCEVIHDEDGDHMWYCGDGYGSLGYAKGHALASVKVEMRSGPTLVPDNSWSKWSLAPLRSSEKANGRYLQVRVSLETQEAAVSPVVGNLRLN